MKTLYHRSTLILLAVGILDYLNTARLVADVSLEIPIPSAARPDYFEYTALISPVSLYDIIPFKYPRVIFKVLTPIERTRGSNTYTLSSDSSLNHIVQKEEQ